MEVNVMNKTFGKTVSQLSEKELFDILGAVFYGDAPDELEKTKEPDKRDLLGELTTSFILDGLDVTRKDTLMMVLFDNRTRIANGEKLTHHINLVHRK